MCPVGEAQEPAGFGPVKRSGEGQHGPYGRRDPAGEASLNVDDQWSIKRDGSAALLVRVRDLRVKALDQERCILRAHSSFSDLDERLQLAHVMGVARGVPHARHGDRASVIVDDDAGAIRQKSTELGADVIEGQLRRAGDMQQRVWRHFRKAVRVHVLERRRGDVISHYIW